MDIFVALLVSFVLLLVSVANGYFVAYPLLGAIAIGIQGYSSLELITFAIAGFHVPEDSPLATILIGGGVMSMAKVCVVVILSTALAGMLTGTQALAAIQMALAKATSRSNLFFSTGLVGIAAAAFGCTQAIAILLTQQLVQHQYANRHQPQAVLASDLENTVVVMAPLIPWNIAGLVPATVLMVGVGFIPYAVYLYLLPLVTLIHLKQRERTQSQLCNSPLKRKINS